MTNEVSAKKQELSVIVPAFRAENTIQSCLSALFDAGFRPEDVTVIDDGSPDRTGEIARAAGVHVISNPEPTRPARARNKGAAQAEGDILVFVDADVIVHSVLRSKVEQNFQDPSLTAVIGSYDDAPTAPSVVSRYRNILHHVTHQDAAGDIDTFWSGIGAVRRESFEAAGGFDPQWEDIEDVELGLRMTANGGRIRLDPTMLGTHLKDWTVRGMFRTDLYGRAVPWTRLLRSGRMPVGTLNTSGRHRVSAGAVALAVLAIPTMLFTSMAAWLFLVSALVFLLANLSLMKRLAGAGGVAFALSSLPYHALHYLAGILGYSKVRFLEKGDA